MEGKTQETAAAKAGMSVRSARKWQIGPLPSATKPEHRWRTRPDPFDGVWEDEIEPLLRSDPTGKLKATTIIDCPSTSSGGGAASRPVQRRPAAHPATTIAGPSAGLRRRALHGPDQEVYFPQEHPPGRAAQIDFTHGNSLSVTIAGQPYRHLLFQLILSHSGWRYAEIAASETFLALQQGLQNAPWTLGGVPQILRSDNTSAATHEVKRSRGRALNDNYAGLLDHYGSVPPASISASATKTASLSRLTTGSRTPSTRPSSCGAAAISTPPATTPASSGRWWRDAIAWYRGSWSRKCFAWAPCRQLRCRNTSTTKPGCASGAPSR